MTKFTDDRSITFPIKISEIEVVHDLSYLREIISFMPLFVFNTLGLGKLRPRSVVIQMEDRTRVQLERIIEDILIKFRKFTFLLILLFIITMQMKRYYS